MRRQWRSWLRSSFPTRLLDRKIQLYFCNQKESLLALSLFDISFFFFNVCRQLKSFKIKSYWLEVQRQSYCPRFWSCRVRHLQDRWCEVSGGINLDIVYVRYVGWKKMITWVPSPERLIYYYYKWSAWKADLTFPSSFSTCLVHFYQHTTTS